MKEPFNLKPGQSFRKNARVLLRSLLNDFLSYRKIVLADSSHIKQLHKMRIAGKTLRYAMETHQSLFDKKFKQRLEEVKRVLELMGTIHDCDVCIETLNSFMNKQLTVSTQSAGKTNTIHSIAILLEQQAQQRSEAYLAFCSVMVKWKKEKTDIKIMNSLH